MSAHQTSTPLDGDSPAVSKLPLVVMGAIVAFAALVAVVLIVTRGPASYDEGSPEAALQGFVQAGLDDNTEEMLALMTPPARTRCRADLQTESRSSGSNDSLRVLLDELDVTGNIALASVEIERSAAGDPFNGSDRSTIARIELVRSDREWFVDSSEWPHSLRRCSGT